MEYWRIVYMKKKHETSPEKNAPNKLNALPLFAANAHERRVLACA